MISDGQISSLYGSISVIKVLEDMDFLIELMRPTFRSYYDLIRYISLKKCRKMSEPSEYVGSSDYGNTGC